MLYMNFTYSLTQLARAIINGCVEQLMTTTTMMQRNRTLLQRLGTTLPMATSITTRSSANSSYFVQCVSHVGFTVATVK